MTEQNAVHVRHAAKRPGHPIIKGVAWFVAAVAGFGLVFVPTYKAQIESHITTVKDEQISALIGPDRPAAALPPADGSSGAAVNILLMGSDDRSGENGVIGGKESGKRNDTTIIMHISADRSRIEAISIPRDTIVRVADCQLEDGTTVKGWTGMFNIAFANGAKKGSNAAGAACTVKTVEAITDIPIDHFAVIDFVGFQNMVDAVGGVPMCIPNAVSDNYSGTSLAAGPTVLNGPEALAYARMRHGNGLSGSDLDRIDRQQQLLKNLASKVLSAQMLYRPLDVTRFIKAVADSLTVDEQMGDLDYLGGLAFSLRNLDPKTGIVFATAPVEGYPADPNRVQFSRKAATIWAAIVADQPIADLLDSQSNSPANAEADEAGTDAGTDAGATPAPGAVDPNSQDGILAACTT